MSRPNDFRQQALKEIVERIDNHRATLENAKEMIKLLEAQKQAMVNWIIQEDADFAIGDPVRPQGETGYYFIVDVQVNHSSGPLLYELTRPTPEGRMQENDPMGTVTKAESVLSPANPYTVPDVVLSEVSDKYWERSYEEELITEAEAKSQQIMPPQEADEADESESPVLTERHVSTVLSLTNSFMENLKEAEDAEEEAEVTRLFLSDVQTLQEAKEQFSNVDWKRVYDQLDLEDSA